MGDCVSRTPQADEQPNVYSQTLPVKSIYSGKSNRKSARNAKTEDQMYQILSEYFDMFDINRNNCISFDEVVKMLQQIQTNVNQRRKKGKIEIDMSEAKHFFRRMDVNGDKMITKEEFYRFYKSM